MGCSTLPLAQAIDSRVNPPECSCLPHKKHDLFFTYLYLLLYLFYFPLIHLLLSILFRLQEVNLKFDYPEYHLAQRNYIETLNLCVACVGLAALLLCGGVFFANVAGAWRRRKAWSYRRFRVVRLTSAEIAVQFVNLVRCVRCVQGCCACLVAGGASGCRACKGARVAGESRRLLHHAHHHPRPPPAPLSLPALLQTMLLMPNALQFAHPCSWFVPAVHWAGSIQWTCWNTLVGAALRCACACACLACYCGVVIARLGKHICCCLAACSSRGGSMPPPAHPPLTCLRPPLAVGPLAHASPQPDAGGAAAQPLALRALCRQATAVDDH